jgi:acyl-CoA dehydrogenase
MSFESTLVQIEERAANAAPLGSTLRFDFGDNHIFLDGSGEANVVTTENNDAACVVHVTLEDLEAILDGRLNPMFAFMSGKIKVKGEMGLAMKLQSLLG